MLNLYKYRKEIGVTILLIFCALLLVGTSPYPSTCNNHTQCQEASHQERPKEDCSTLDIIVFRDTFAFIGRNVNDISAGISALATIAIAGFTATLWLTSREQGRLTQRAIEISDKGLTIAQWPHFYIDEQRFTTPISRPHPSATVQFTYRAAIHGQSPAMIRAVYGEIVFDTRVPVTPQRRKHWRVTHGVQRDGFGLEQTIFWEGEDIITTPQERAAARAAGKWLYAIGCIIYDDLFGNQYEFEFCYRGALGGGWGIRDGGQAYNYHRLRDDTERAQTDALQTVPPIEPPEPSPPC